MDVESHNDKESKLKGETSIWLGCMINENSNLNDENCYFYTIDEYLDKLQELSSRKRKKVKGKLQKRPCNNICNYIYNLSFEWSFILPVLLKRGFKGVDKIEKDMENVYSSVTTKSVSSVWQIELKFGKKDGSILLRDLAKMYGGGLRQVAEVFKLPTLKGEIDYELNRLHGHIVTKEEKEYCFKDCKIVMDVLMAEQDDKDFFNSMSMASYSVSQLIKYAYRKSYKPYREFRKEYPELSQEENEFVRKSLSGGICYAIPSFQFKEIHKQVLHIDAHQMYPSQVVLKPHPYGEGEYFVGRPTKFVKHLNCCHIRISYDDVIVHSVIKLISQPFAEDFELYVWDFEIETMKKCYINLKIEYIDGYCYRSRYLPWKGMVKDNYLKRLQAKALGDSYNVQRYKLLNNSGAYGKFVEKPHNITFINTIREDGIIDSDVMIKEDVKITAKYTYIPLSTIPAYGRCCLVETALKFLYNPSTKKYDRNNVCYFDTDSIFVIYDEWSKYVWETQINKNDELGGWGLEHIIERSQFTAPKRYKIEYQGKNELKSDIKAGGINFTSYIIDTHQEEIDELMESGLTKFEAIKQIGIGFDDIDITSSSWQVQRAYRVKGGTIIDFQRKDMNIQEKYIDIYNKNHHNIIER